MVISRTTRFEFCLSGKRRNKFQGRIFSVAESIQNVLFSLVYHFVSLNDSFIFKCPFLVTFETASCIVNKFRWYNTYANWSLLTLWMKTFYIIVSMSSFYLFHLYLSYKGWSLSFMDDEFLDDFWQNVWRFLRKCNWLRRRTWWSLNEKSIDFVELFDCIETTTNCTQKYVQPSEVVYLLKKTFEYFRNLSWWTIWAKQTYFSLFERQKSSEWRFRAWKYFMKILSHKNGKTFGLIRNFDEVLSNWREDFA